MNQKNIRISILGYQINFRDKFHKEWFLTCFHFFIIAIFLTGLIIFIKAINIYNPSSFIQKLRFDFILMTPFGIGTIAYFVIFIMSFVKTRAGKKVAGNYSPDCIWFNGLVFIVYLILLFLVKHLNCNLF